MSINVNNNVISSTGFNTSGDIINTPVCVTDNLILWLDAGNNASYMNTSTYYDCGYGCQYYSSDPGCTNCNTKWMDMSGYGNDGVFYSGATVAYTNSGGEVIFDGSNDVVKLSTSLLTGTGDFTFCAWIKRSATGTVDYIMGNYGLLNPGGIEFYIASDKLYTFISGSVVSTGTIDTSWHHVATTRTSGAIQMYIDSATDGNGTLASSITGTNVFTVGSGADYSSEAFVGSIAAVQAYNRALSATEILQNFNAGRQRFGI